jgi:NADPH-dependent 7-cyano-7-deazaguanine reductase QueF
MGEQTDLFVTHEWKSMCEPSNLPPTAPVEVTGVPVNLVNENKLINE